MIHTVHFPVFVETDSGEETWNVTATLYRESGRYWFDSFSAESEDGEHKYDEAGDFAAYCEDTGNFDPDLIARATEEINAQAMREAEIDEESARGDWLYEQAKDRRLG